MTPEIWQQIIDLAYLIAGGVAVFMVLGLIVIAVFFRGLNKRFDKF